MTPVSMEGPDVRDPIAGIKLAILVLALLIAQILDGMDMNALAFVGQGVRGELELSRAIFGACIGAAFLGTAIGAAGFGAIADRIGRRVALLIVVALFGVGSLATSQVTNATELLILRGLTGMALGGLLPISSALLIGNVSARARTTAVTIVTSGSAGGAVLAGFVSSFVVPHFGWRSMFVVGGLAPLVILPLLLLVLPNDRRPVRVSGAAGGQGASLFREGAWRVTLHLWIGMFFAALPVFVAVGWLPSLIEANGATPGQAAIAASLFSIGGALGGVLAGWLTDRFGTRMILPIALAGAASVVALGLAIGSPAGAPVAFAAGFCAVGLLTLMGALSGQFYPDAIRGLGVGASLAVMRCGAAIAPWAAGKALDLGSTAPLLFAAAGVASVVSGLFFMAAARASES